MPPPQPLNPQGVNRWTPVPTAYNQLNEPSIPSTDDTYRPPPYSQDVAAPASAFTPVSLPDTSISHEALVPDEPPPPYASVTVDDLPPPPTYEEVARQQLH